MFPWFGIGKAANTGVAIDTTATFTVSGWEGATGNTTQEFIHIVDGDMEFNLTGIGTRTAEWDQPLAAGRVKGLITNVPGPMIHSVTPGNTVPIAITVTSRDTSSGVGWFPVRIPVKGFGDIANG
ncbi:MAG: hypothetical protein LBD18_00280 [Treponema sp.]|nr:hypothetical protein [Treponema sp.]